MPKSVIPKTVYDQLQKSNKKITKTSVKLHGYGEHDIPVIGTIRLRCRVNDVKNRQISMWHIKNQDDFRIKELQRYDISENHG